MNIPININSIQYKNINNEEEIPTNQPIINMDGII